MPSNATAKKPKEPFSLQEHVEWVAMAFVLALTVRCFVVEAYQIPTGSMAPTLYGNYYMMSCSSCGKKFARSAPEPERAEYATGYICPSCGTNDATRKRPFVHGGDRILVAKDLYVFSKPQRWDVFVFKTPEEGKSDKNYVKRLIGLPGERIQLRNGQVFVDGQIARKPEHVQRELWLPVYDMRSDTREAPSWTSVAGWEVRGGKLSLVDASKVWQTVSYSQPIVDFYPYNGRQGDNVVGDILITGHVNIDADQSSFAAVILDGDHTVKAIFTPIDGRLEIQLRRDERLIGTTVSTVAAPRDFDFSLSTLDGGVEVCVNGVTAISNLEDMAPEDAPFFTDSSGVAFSGYGTKLLVSDVLIRRDVYYSSTLGRADRYLAPHDFFGEDVPPGHYLGLGDNSPVSSDSRIWRFIPEENVLGRAFLLFWPPTRIRLVF